MEVFSNPQDLVSYSLSSKGTPGSSDHWIEITATLTVPSPGGVWSPYQIEILALTLWNPSDFIKFMSKPGASSWFGKDFSCEIRGDAVIWNRSGEAEFEVATPYNESFRDLLREMASLDLKVEMA